MLTESAGKYAGRVAVIHGDQRITYRELEQAACALANHLRSLGLGKGDKVALMLPNCPEFIIAYFGIQKMGGVAVTLNVQSTPYELRHLLGNSDTRCLIMQGCARKAVRGDPGGTSPLPPPHHDQRPVEEDSPFREIITKGPFTDGDPGT